MKFNELSQADFVDQFGPLYEHSPWIAERAHGLGLTEEHNDPEKLCATFRLVLGQASHGEQLALIQAHPDLVGKAAVAGQLTEDSTVEQSSAGLNQCSKEEFERFNHLNGAYKEKFGFPFVMAVRNSHRHEILDAFEKRYLNAVDVEFDTAIEQIHIIARLRLDALLC